MQDLKKKKIGNPENGKQMLWLTEKIVFNRHLQDYEAAPASQTVIA